MAGVPGKYMGYSLHWRHHVDRAQAVDALEHRHTMGMPHRTRLRWTDASEIGEAAATGMGCDCSSDKKDKKKGKKAKGNIEMSSVASAIEHVEAEPAAEPETVGAPSEVEAALSPSSDQFVMLGEEAAVDEAADLARRVEATIEKHGDDFERQPPMSEHFVTAFHQMVQAGAFEPNSQFQSSASTIVKEKMIAGDAGFRTVAIQQLGEEACAPMFAVVDKVLEAEQ